MIVRYILYCCFSGLHSFFNILKMKPLRFRGWLCSRLQIKMPILLGLIEGANPESILLYYLHNVFHRLELLMLHHSTLVQIGPDFFGSFECLWTNSRLIHVPYFFCF
jgi:hypothetical protein